MRTFSSEAQAAMDSGVFEPYIRAGIADASPENIIEWIQPVYYKLSDTELEATLPLDYITPGYGIDFIALRRGVYINGTPETTTTSSFYIISHTSDEKFLYIKAHLLPDVYKSLTPNLTYKQILEQIYLDETQQQIPIITPTYEFPSHVVWNYQFYPTGRDVTFNNLQTLQSLLRQKFLIFLRHTENTYNSNWKTDIYFFQPTETRSIDYTITDLLFRTVSSLQYRTLLWRDDSMTSHIYNPNTLYIYPIHNLGYIPTSGTRPTYAPSPRTGSQSSKLIPNLKYETGDYVNIISNSFSNNFRIQVTEFFDIKTSPTWYLIINPLTWFDKTEGGGIPSTIFASAPYTPLATTNFNNNLDETVNNLQALAEAVDELELGESFPSTIAANDFLISESIGGGFFAFVKKTLSETITILRTALDLVYSGISHSHTASAISITDAGNLITATDVEGALQELAASGGGGSSSLLSLDKVSSAPAYEADKALMYFLDTGDLLARMKIGALEREFVIATMKTTITLPTYIGASMISSAATSNSNLATQTANTGWIGERNDAAQIRRVLLKYAALSDGTIPPTATIISAKLFLYVNGDYSSNARTLNVFRVLRAYNPAQATWNVYTTGNNWTTAGCGSAGNDYDNTVVGSRAFSASETLNEYKEIDLDPALIQDFVDGSWTDNGFILRFQTETDDAYRFNLSVANETNLPYIEVVYL